MITDEELQKRDVSKRIATNLIRLFQDWERNFNPETDPTILALNDYKTENTFIQMKLETPSLTDDKHKAFIQSWKRFRYNETLKTLAKDPPLGTLIMLDQALAQRIQDKKPQALTQEPVLTKTGNPHGTK